MTWRANLSRSLRQEPLSLFDGGPCQRLHERDRRLVRACKVAIRDPEVQAIEREFDAISKEIPEPWSDAKARRGVVGAPRSTPRVRD